MKVFRLCTVVALAIALLTSCLGDSDTTETYYGMPGVVVYKNGKAVVETVRGNMYSPAVLSGGFSIGDCVLISYVLDTKTEGNDYDSYQKNDYYNVAVTALSGVDQGETSTYPSSMVADTTQLMTYGDEFALKEGFVRSDWQFFSYFEESGKLILTSSFIGLEGQKNKFYLHIDTEQKPEKRPTSYDGDANVYKAILRASITSEGKTPKQDTYQMNAFDVKSAMNMIDRIEKEKGECKYFGLEIVYLSDIAESETNEEGEQEDPVLTWKTSTTAVILQTVSKDN